MAQVQLTHTGEQLDEAIRKVRSSYADVSETTATESTVRVGRKFVKADKTLATGTMPDATVTASAAISGSAVGDSVSTYPITIIPKATLNRAGYCANGHTATPVTKYIQTQMVTVTENGTVTPASGRLLMAVVVNVPQAQLKVLSTSLANDDLLILNNSQNGAFCEYFDIYVDSDTSPADSVAAASSVHYNLLNLSLSAGTHTIKTKARGTGMQDSPYSTEHEYIVGASLNAPTLSLSGYTLTITSNNTGVNETDEVYADDVKVGEV